MKQVMASKEYIPTHDLGCCSQFDPASPICQNCDCSHIDEHEGRAALLEMGEAIPDASELPGVTIPEPEAQGVIPPPIVSLGGR